MQIFSNEKVIYNFVHGMEEAYRVKNNEIFTVKTNDCFLQQMKSEDQVLEKIDFGQLNSATGPIYVENSKVGDVLKVDILDIKTEDSGVSLTSAGEGAIGEDIEKSIVRIIKSENGKAIFKGVEIPVDPMIGVIGVAPKEEDGTWGTHNPWKHGGNMDTKLIKKGNTIYFKVNQDGAMLALGDLHMVMGDGEVCFTGVEVPGEVTLRVSVLKEKRNLEWPLLETENKSIVIASGDDLEMAMKSATREAVKIISETLDITFEEAYIMASQTVDLRISQVVNQKKTIRAEIPKFVVSTEKILEK